MTSVWLERLREWDGKDVAVLEELFDLLASEELLNETCDAACEAGGVAQIAATWLQKRQLESGVKWGRERGLGWFAQLELLDSWESKLHALQCLPYLHVPRGAHRALEAFARDCLTSDVKFVQAWALTGMHALAVANEAVRGEVQALLLAASKDGPASVRARARKLLKQGF